MRFVQEIFRRLTCHSNQSKNTQDPVPAPVVPAPIVPALVVVVPVEPSIQTVIKSSPRAPSLRPRNSYMIFAADVRKHNTEDILGKPARQQGEILGKMWRELSVTKKDTYSAIASSERLSHKEWKENTN